MDLTPGSERPPSGDQPLDAELLNLQGPPLTSDVLIAIGAIIATDPNANQTVWQGLATQEGAHLTDTVKLEVRDQISAVMDRMANVGATQDVLDALATVAKMQIGPPGPGPMVEEEADAVPPADAPKPTDPPGGG